MQRYDISQLSRYGIGKVKSATAPTIRKGNLITTTVRTGNLAFPTVQSNGRVAHTVHDGGPDACTIRNDGPALTSCRLAFLQRLRRGSDNHLLPDIEDENCAKWHMVLQRWKLWQTTRKFCVSEILNPIFELYYSGSIIPLPSSDRGNLIAFILHIYITIIPQPCAQTRYNTVRLNNR